MDTHWVVCTHETPNGHLLAIRENVIFCLDLFAGSNGQGGPDVKHSPVEMPSARKTAAEDGIHGGAASFRNVKEDQDLRWQDRWLVEYFRTDLHRIVAPGSSVRLSQTAAKSVAWSYDNEPRSISIISLGDDVVEDRALTFRAWSDHRKKRLTARRGGREDDRDRR